TRPPTSVSLTLPTWRARPLGVKQRHRKPWSLPNWAADGACDVATSSTGWLLGGEFDDVVEDELVLLAEGVAAGGVGDCFDDGDLGVAAAAVASGRGGVAFGAPVAAVGGGP